jgi:hypothetical protein
MPNLFSYGTLQKKQVQLKTFGRLLTGKKDALSGYSLKVVEITDPDVLRKSGQKFHPIIEFTGHITDKVDGVLFEVTEGELLNADAYEVNDYKRIFAKFKSGKQGFVYVQK